MNPNNSTAIIKFEEFFSSNNYKDEVFNILEEYPDRRSLIVNYNDLEMFDPDLADLLIDKPTEVIHAARIAIKNIDPLVKDADINIRFDNFTNIIPLDSVSSRYVNTFISVDAVIEKINNPEPKIITGVFECRGCMRLHEVEEDDSFKIKEPTLCSECGTRSFRLLEDESQYIDSQALMLGMSFGDNKTPRKLKVIVEDDLTSYNDYTLGQLVRVTGVLKTRSNKNGKYTVYLQGNNIKKLDSEELKQYDYEIDSTGEYGDRNSPEYRMWRDKVISRDRVCQCCGGDKHLQAHHVFGYKHNKDLRVDDENGITLCVFCHKKYHSYYGLGNANPKDLVKFIRRFSVR